MAITTKTGIVCFVVLLMIACALCLNGCKYSDILTEHIEDPENGVLDEKASPVFKHNPLAPEDPDWLSAMLQDSTRIDDQSQDLPEFDDEQHLDESTDQRENADDTPYDQNATTGNQPSENEGDNSHTGGSNQQRQNDSTGNGSQDNESPSQNPEEQPEDDPNGAAQEGPADSGAGGDANTYDAAGASVELPEDVGSIAAAGDYALIVQMLAGSGGLAATDEEFPAIVQSRGLFPGEGVESVPIVWSGSRSRGFSLDVAALVATGADCVLVDNIQVSLTADQSQQLQDAGISVVTVPSLGSPDTPDETIVRAVAVVGQLLSSASTQFNTSEKVSVYNSRHDEALQACLNANGGYSVKAVMGMYYSGIYQGTSMSGLPTTSFSNVCFTTAFIDSWTYDVNPSPLANRRYSSVSMGFLDGEAVDASGGVGLSAAGLSGNFMLLDYYLQVAGVVNNAYDVSKPPLPSGDGRLRYYVVVPGDYEGLPSATLLDRLVSRSAPSALWYSTSSLGAGGVWETVGDPDFPGVLVRSDAIAHSVANSANNPRGIYNVGQSYTVRVVPDGAFGSWADGTPESFLLAPWAFCAFQADGDLSIADTYVERFYSDFYRCSIDSIANYNTVYRAG